MSDLITGPLHEASQLELLKIAEANGALAEAETTLSEQYATARSAREGVESQANAAAKAAQEAEERDRQLHISAKEAQAAERLARDAAAAALLEGELGVEPLHIYREARDRAQIHAAAILASLFSARAAKRAELEVTLSRWMAAAEEARLLRELRTLQKCRLSLPLLSAEGSMTLQGGATEQLSEAIIEFRRRAQETLAALQAHDAETARLRKVHNL